MNKNNPQKILSLINKSKESLKDSPVFKKMCEKYKQDVDIIDDIPIYFKDLDVSAKTDHGIIYLNSKLLQHDIEKSNSYLIHEISHFFQQCFNDKPTNTNHDQSYLDNPYEIEGFQNQIEFIADELGEDKAEKYVESLLDHHDVDDSEKKEKEEVLMAKV